MSKFLDDLRLYVDNCRSGGVYISPRQAALRLIDSLGENARRMLDIGMVQDELVKLGFNFEILYDNKRIECMISKKYESILFWNDAATFKCKEFYYTSTTWQEDLLDFIKRKNK